MKFQTTLWSFNDQTVARDLRRSHSHPQEGVAEGEGDITTTMEAIHFSG